jgi:hypothetical protein
VGHAGIGANVSVQWRPIHFEVKIAMNPMLRIFQTFVFFFSAAAVWLGTTSLALAADSGGGKGAEGMTDYMLSYLVVILGIVLGLLVVAKASNRRDRERPAGYVEKNIMADE